MAEVNWSVDMFMDCERRNFVIQLYSFKWSEYYVSEIALSHAAHLDLDTSTSFFGVYDGHGVVEEAMFGQSLFLVTKHLTCPTKTREALKICSYSLLLDGFGWFLPYIGVYNKTRYATGLVAPAIIAALGALTHTLGTLIPVIGASGFATAATAIGTIVGSFR